MKRTPEADFSSYTLSTGIYKAIQEAGFKHPTDVQREVIPAILRGEDVLARAETGSGKTAAYVLPLLEKINRARSKGLKKRRGNQVDIIVLVPTRELAIQVREEFERFSSHLSDRVKCLSVYGGVKINPQMIALRGGAEVLVSTPGRLLDLARQNALLLNVCKTLVVDEVDRLMKGDFKEEIEAIFKQLPKKRQNLMFTATFPDSIRPLVRQIMNQPHIVNVDDIDDDVMIHQRVFTVNHDKKNDLTAHLLKENDWKQVLIFCSAKRTCDNVVRKLEKRDIKAVAMHGNMQQNARARALKEFKEGKTRILIATDVAARGIDIEQLPCVINYELPRSPNDYTHRIGRTGRAGEAGTAISLISHKDYGHFKVIEKRNGICLEREQIKGLEADKEAPEDMVRSKPKKKAKSKKRKALVQKKVLTKKQKAAQQQAQHKAENKQQAMDKKAYFAEKAKAERKTERKVNKKASDKKPAISERVAFHENDAGNSQPKPVSGASLYTRKLPKGDD